MDLVGNSTMRKWEFIIFTSLKLLAVDEFDWTLYPLVVLKGQSNLIEAVDVPAELEGSKLNIWLEDKMLTVSSTIVTNRKATFIVNVPMEMEERLVWTRVYTEKKIGKWRPIFIKADNLIVEHKDASSTDTILITNLPVKIVGVLNSYHQIDRWHLILKSSGILSVQLQALRLGQPLHLQVWIEDEQSKIIAQSQASDFKDPPNLEVECRPGRVIINITSLGNIDFSKKFLQYLLDLNVKFDISESISSIEKSGIPSPLSVPIPVEPPITVNGMIGGIDDQDIYSLRLLRGQRLRIILNTSSLGSALHPILKVLYANGLLVYESEALEQDFDLTAPATGEYFIVICDQYKQGGPGYMYQLHLARPTPTLSFFILQHTFECKLGETIQIPLRVDLGDNNMVVSISPLDEIAGIEFERVLASEMNQRLDIKCKVKESVPPGDYQFRLIALPVNYPSSSCIGSVELADSFLMELLPLQWIWLRVK